MKTDLFQSWSHCWVFQLCWHIECSTFTTPSFRIWNSSTGIPSPPPALFIVMLPKAHLTSHSRMSGSRWVITPSWLSGSWRSFLYGSSVSLGNYALNQQCDTTPHRLGWQHQMLTRMWSNRNSFTAGEDAEWWEFGSFLQSLNSLFVRSSNCSPELQVLCPCTNVDVNVHSGFINNCQKPEATKKSSKTWIDKIGTAVQCMEMSNQVPKPGRKFNCIIAFERSQSESHTIWFQLYDILEKAKLETVKRSVVIHF